MKGAGEMLTFNDLVGGAPAMLRERREEWAIERLLVLD